MLEYAQMFDRYGVSLGMLLVFLFASWYILRRLLHEDKGLLTKYVKSTQEQQSQLAVSVAQHAETDAKIAALMEQTDHRLLLLVDGEEHSRQSNVYLINYFRHGCDALEQISAKLGLADQTKPCIEQMRRELAAYLQHTLRAE